MRGRVGCMFGRTQAQRARPIVRLGACGSEGRQPILGCARRAAPGCLPARLTASAASNCTAATPRHASPDRRESFFGGLDETTWPVRRRRLCFRHCVGPGGRPGGRPAGALREVAPSGARQSRGACLWRDICRSGRGHKPRAPTWDCWPPSWAQVSMAAEPQAVVAEHLPGLLPAACRRRTGRERERRPRLRVVPVIAPLTHGG